MNIKNEKGIALIMSIGIVAMLAIIGTTFAINMRLEQKAAANYLASSKAKALAEAGIDHAIAVLKLYAITQAYSDIDDNWRLPITSTAIKIYGTSDYSGAYEVSVVECASQIYINDGVYLTGTSKTERESRLGSMLNNLAAALSVSGWSTPADGNNIANSVLRPYSIKEQIKNVINGSKYDAIKDYITVNTWVDPNTIRPSDISNQPKAPVNVNTALRPVLIAVLRDVATSAVSIDLTDAGNVADQIITQRQIFPFTNWHGTLSTGGFNQFINSLVSGTISPQGKAEVIKANADPNTRLSLNTVNPNREWKASADKTKLTVNTTEFCFSSMGYYELESTGTVTIGSDPNPVARKKIKAVVKLYDLWRQTTQSQFGNGTISQVSSANTLYTYPEPIDVGITAADYDGQIMLANVEATGGIFRASFNNDLDADVSGGVATAGGTLDEISVIAAGAGDLFPDGVFIYGSGGSGEYLTYGMASNFPSDLTNAGTIEMWVKPSYNPPSDTHYFFSFQDTIPPTAPTEYVRLYDNNGTLTFSVKDSTNPGDLSDTSDITAWNDGEWNHIAANFDWDDGTGKTLLELFVNGVTNGPMSTAGLIYRVDAATTMYIGSDSSGAATQNWANSTIDELRISNSIVYTSGVDFTVSDRYYDDTAGSLISANVARFTSAQFPTVAFTTPVSWGTITWTGLTPSGYSPSNGIGLDVNAGDGWPALTTTPDFTSATSANRISSATSSSSSSIRYKVRVAGTGTPLKDTPVLDDVTITYLSPVRFFSYQEVTE